MEILGSFLDEEWESLSKLFSCGENSDSLQHFDGSGLFTSNGEMPFLANSDQSLFFSSDHHTFTTDFSSFSQESSNNDAVFSDKCNGDHQPYNDNTFAPMNYYNMDSSNATVTMMPVFPDDVMGEILYSKGENQPAETGDDSCKLKRKCGDHPLPESSPKKIPRRNAQKNPRKNKKKMQEEENNKEEEGGNRQSSSSCSSEEDSQELNGGSTSESKGSASAKTKANRGSATDPQSLYARRRREKINERLKILQNLVPNGTKVDISTMLEEAVQYVKFLQLQIKLLSSDDMWMYAPLAYNGMDIGIYQRFPQI